MGLAGNLLALVSILIAVSLYFKIKLVFESPAKPIVDDIWWGPGDPSTTDTNIKPFQINVSDDVSNFSLEQCRKSI